MTKKLALVSIIVSLVLGALNIILFVALVSGPVHASVGGMGYSDLRRDRDFRRAVESIVEDCSVDGESISC